MNRQALLGHALVMLATVAGIWGMGTTFAGVMHGSVAEICRGAPFLLVGLWWAGRDLGRSIMVSRARKAGTAPPIRG